MSEFDFRRDDLYDAFGSQRMVAQFENAMTQVKTNTVTIGGLQEDSAAFQDASYLTLGLNTALTAERVVTPGNLIKLTDGGPGGAFTVAVDRLTMSGAFTLGLTLTANSALTLPATGTLATLAGAETLTNKTLDQLRTTQVPVAAAGVAATHKVAIRLGGVDYFVLLAA